MNFCSKQDHYLENYNVTPLAKINSEYFVDLLTDYHSQTLIWMTETKVSPNLLI